MKDDLVNDTISRAAVLDFIDSMNWCDEISDEAFKKITIHLENLPSAQPSLYGYDFRNLIVFADAVNKKGISDSEIEDFVRNARAAWEYAWEEFQRTQKEALDSIMRGDHHEEP